MNHGLRFGLITVVLLEGCASVLGADFDHPGASAADGGDGDAITADVVEEARPAAEGGDAAPTDAADAHSHADAPSDAPAGASSVLLFGGYSGNTVFDDGWTFDGSAWKQACSACAPSARYLGVAATLGNALVLYAGATPYSADVASENLGDTWTYDGHTWTQVCATCKPPSRYRSMMAPLGNDLVLFGGAGDSADLQDTWIFDGTRWTQVQPCDACAPPPARDTATMAALNGKVVLFGGWGNSGAELRDTWTFDGSTWTQVCSTCAPPGRGGAAMATLGDEVVLFGGRDQSTFLQDTWTFDGTTWTKVCDTCSPPPRYQTSMATFGNEVVLFGGEDGNGKKWGDTWTFDGAAWTQVCSACGPSARAGSVLGTL